MLSAESISRSYNRPSCIKAVKQSQGTPSRVPQKRGWLKSDYNKAARNDEKFLDALKTKGTMKKSQLADFTGVSYTALTACVTRLKRAGLITVFIDGTCARGVERASYVLSK